VAEEDGFDEFSGELFVVVVELAGGFENEAEVVGWAAFVGVEEEQICADGECGCEPAEDVEGGLAGAGFVAAQLPS
jgi:hypothetical protein